MSVTATDPHLTREEAFDLLANTRRRCVLHYLRRVEGAADLGDMASRIAAWEFGTTVDDVDSDQRRRVYTTLQQTHLRKLEDAGIVEYDAGNGRVYPTDAAEDLEVYLEIVPGRGFPWREWYLALGAVSSALLVVTLANVGPFALLPGMLVSALVALALTVSAAAHAVHEHTGWLDEDERPPGVGDDRSRGVANDGSGAIDDARPGTER